MGVGCLTGVSVCIRLAGCCVSIVLSCDRSAVMWSMVPALLLLLLPLVVVDA